jgi:hypothetical protein
LESIKSWSGRYIRGYDQKTWVVDQGTWDQLCNFLYILYKDFAREKNLKEDDWRGGKKKEE